MASTGRRLHDGSLDADMWDAYVSDQHGGRVFWLNTMNGQRTWQQPMPRLEHVSKVIEQSPEAALLRASLAKLGAEFTRICWVCAMPFGSMVGSRKTVAGHPASADAVLLAMLQIGLEFALYPAGFPRAAGLDQIVFCTQLHYGGQRRGHVPSFHARTMYIDCANAPKRRVISSFHHELWHFADYTMLGRDYEFADAEWQALNPATFRYGTGGAAMREADSTSGYLGSAGSDAFLNRYSTASAAEDKAEVWSALMTDMQLVAASPVLAKKRDMLKARATELLGAMGSDKFWRAVRDAQALRRGAESDWEEYTTDAGKSWWFNRVTHEKQWTPPTADAAGAHAKASKRTAADRELARAAEVAVRHDAVKVDAKASSDSNSESSTPKRPRMLACFPCLPCFPCFGTTHEVVPVSEAAPRTFGTRVG